MKQPAPTAVPAHEPRHPIAVVAARTGLSQDVLRVWERRYRAVEPARAPDGQRLYSDADIERLRWLRLGTDAGRSIGQIARLSSVKLKAMVEEDSAALAAVTTVSADLSADQKIDPARLNETVANALARARDLDARGLEVELRRTASLLGVSIFLEEIASTMLRRIGDEWHAGRLTIAQEHLASAVVQEVVVASMRQLARNDGAPRMIVATPAGERHALGAALVGARAAAVGWNVVYLGADMPAEDLAASAVSSSARAVALSLIYVEDQKKLLREVRTLRERVPADIPIVMGGKGAVGLKRDLESVGVTVIESLADFAGPAGPP